MKIYFKEKKEDENTPKGNRSAVTAAATAVVHLRIQFEVYLHRKNLKSPHAPGKKKTQKINIFYIIKKAPKLLQGRPPNSLGLLLL